MTMSRSSKYAVRHRNPQKTEMLNGTSNTFTNVCGEQGVFARQLGVGYHETDAGIPSQLNTIRCKSSWNQKLTTILIITKKKKFKLKWCRIYNPSNTKVKFPISVMLTGVLSCSQGTVQPISLCLYLVFILIVIVLKIFFGKT